MSGGVPLGAAIPYQTLASYPGTVSAMAGTSGSAATRLDAVTPSARTLPVLMWPIEPGNVDPGARAVALPEVLEGKRTLLTNPSSEHEVAADRAIKAWYYRSVAWAYPSRRLVLARERRNTLQPQLSQHEESGQCVTIVCTMSRPGLPRSRTSW